MEKDVNMDDIPEGQMKKISVNDKDILLANVDGMFYAISDTCTHEGCNLSDGTLKDNVVTCPCHFAQFDVTNGKNVASPATGDDIKDEESFEVKVENGKILIEERL